MSVDLDLFTVTLLFVFVVPGLVSVTIYRQLVPGPTIRWGEALVQGFFYSSINLILLAPLLVWSLDDARSPTTLWLCAILLLLIAPALWPVLLRRLLAFGPVAKRLQSPYATAWDSYFSRRAPTFVLVHLKSGRLLGGFWGERSFATSYPHHGDLYLEEVYRVDESGRFGEKIESTQGALLRREDYDYLELFRPTEDGVIATHSEDLES